MIALSLNTAMVLASDGHGALRFFEAQKVFYLDRRDTRERLVTDAPIWTFVIEASPAARVVLTQLFGMRILEESLFWAPKPGDPSLDDESLGEFREAFVASLRISWRESAPTVRMNGWLDRTLAGCETS